MEAHRHEDGEGHIFVDKDGSRYVCAQGYSQFFDKLPDGAPCPDCEKQKDDAEKKLPVCVMCEKPATGCVGLLPATPVCSPECAHDYVYNSGK